MRRSFLHLLFLFIAGSLGALCRFFIIEFISKVYDKKNTLPFPHHTFIVNMIACFLMGFLLTLFFNGSGLTPFATIIIFGFIGSLSTFSTYIADIFDHIQHRQKLFALSYAIGTLIAGMALGLLGRYLAGGQ